MNLKHVHVYWSIYELKYNNLGFLFYMFKIPTNRFVQFFLLLVQLENGVIIDCIDINKQPALDHPLLKNHKIQVCKIFANLILYV